MNVKVAASLNLTDSPALGKDYLYGIRESASRQNKEQA